MCEGHQWTHRASCTYSVRCDQGSRQCAPWAPPVWGERDTSPQRHRQGRHLSIVASLTGQKWELRVIVGCVSLTVSEFSVFAYVGGLFAASHVHCLQLTFSPLPVQLRRVIS